MISVYVIYLSTTSVFVPINLGTLKSIHRFPFQQFFLFCVKEILIIFEHCRNQANVFSGRRGYKAAKRYVLDRLITD